MKLVADECVAARLIDGLRGAGHEVLSIREVAPGVTDDQVLSRALALEAPLVTVDLDFGEMVYRSRHESPGVILLRMREIALAKQLEILLTALSQHADLIPGAYVVVTPGLIRVRRPDSEPMRP